jgi:hypothetical protein
MTAPAGATSLPARIRTEIDEIAAGFARLSAHSAAIEQAAGEIHIAFGHMLCGFVEDALC